MTRVGLGYDSHRYQPPGPLILGGIRIPYDNHLHGHSDGDAVCHALIDAMLDSSGMLKLLDTEYLSVSASGADQPYSNPLYRDRKLVLSVLVGDLAAYRQGKLTREEAKARIKEERF